MYTLLYNPLFGRVYGIKRTSDGAFVSIDVNNVKYQEFLIWNAAQEVPLDVNGFSQEVLDEIAAGIAKQAAKVQAFIDNLPTWAKVETAIDTAFPDAKQNAVIKKLARVVYWMAKDSEK